MVENKKKQTKSRESAELKEWNISPDRKKVSKKKIAVKKKSSYRTEPVRTPEKKKRSKKGLIVFLMILIASVAFFVWYVSDYYRADYDAVSKAIASEISYVSKEGNTYVFSPYAETNTGVIFYPGGKVEYTAYLPLAEKLAGLGLECYVTDMPFNLAIFDVNAADHIIKNHPEITSWYIGGHSLGGEAAALYVQSSDCIDGIFLLGAYSTADLSSNNLKALVVYGSEDGVLNTDNYERNIPNLPSSTRVCVLKGGNHSLFGNYGFQDGDGTATISADEQQKTTAQYIYEMTQEG